MKGLKNPLVRARVISRKFMVFLFVSMVILRPFDLKILLTSCFVFSMRLDVTLHTARPPSWRRPTLPLNFGVMRDNMYVPMSLHVLAPSYESIVTSNKLLVLFFFHGTFW